MKKIEFIAPVEAMRGNLSGTQDLLYAENDNKAYESPVGSRNYARNYQPRFIGAKRAANGLKYFQVRTKSAVGLSIKAKHQMALLGGAGAIIGAILANKNSDMYRAAVYSFENSSAPETAKKSLRSYLTWMIQRNLERKSRHCFSGLLNATTTFYIANPWVTGAEASAATVNISSEVLIKFASELADPSIFQVTIGETKFVLRNYQVSPANVRESKKWNYMAIPAEFNPQIPTDVHGEHYHLQVDLMDPSKQIMLQYMNGDDVEWYKIIVLNGVKVNSVQDDVIDGAAYDLIDYQG